MPISHLEHAGVHRWAWLVAAAGVVGCSGANSVSCPAVLAACPAVAPDAGGACTARGSAAFCEYGDDPNFDCDVVAFCDPQLGWSVQQISGAPLCPTALPAGCPATFAQAVAGGQNGCGTGTASFQCAYPEGSCFCESADAFTCTAPAPAGCPTVRPRAGAACSAACPLWGTGTCDRQSMRCVCGTWQPVECTE